MASMSDPIAIADATATVFDLPSPRSVVRVGVIFYDDAEATEEDVVAGGARDVAVSAVVPLEGYGVVTMPIVGASAEDVPGGSLKAFDLGTASGRVSVACAVATDPEGATHYRIIVD